MVITRQSFYGEPESAQDRGKVDGATFKRAPLNSLPSWWPPREYDVLVLDYTDYPCSAVVGTDGRIHTADLAVFDVSYFENAAHGGNIHLIYRRGELE
jgi:hypothetical protein